MSKTLDYIEEVGQIVEELEELGFMPVLVGGMALVILGSRRVTRDFDFLVSVENSKQESILNLFYKRGFELASRVSKDGDIIRTIDNQKAAVIRLRLDNPLSVHFLNKQTGLRIDLLFDFPCPASEIASRSKKKKIRSYTFRVASKQDLLYLKEMAYKDRSLAIDAQDLEFLKRS
jgi:hypothetical protein